MIEVSKNGPARRLLFVTWDGPDLSYLEGLFLPILSGLRVHGFEADVLQFRWGDRSRSNAVRRACEAAGLRYRAVQVMRRFGNAGALGTALLGGRQIRGAVREWGSDILMPRSLMPAVATLAAGGAKLRPILFDADGLAADERVEFAGLSPRSRSYRVLRDIEAQIIRESASVIVRSSAARDILLHRAGPPIQPDRFHLVTNGRDEELYSPGSEADRLAVREEVGVSPDAPLMLYVGSVGPQYRFELLGEFAEALRARRPDTRLLVLSGDPERARAILLQHRPTLNPVTQFRSAPAHEVPRFLAAADVGFAFRQVSFSTAAVAPIKLSEYLLSGVPVIGTAAVGDTRDAVRAGVFIDEGEGAERAAAWVLDEVMPTRQRYRQVCRAVGIERFSLRRSVEDYRRALSSIRT